MRTYTKKELIDILDIDGMSDINYDDGSIQASEKEVELFRDELEEAYAMTLEEYSPSSKRIYNFVFKNKI